MNFSSWILSIAGTILLGVVVDIILPGGKIQKYVKSVFAFVMILVIITPLPGLLRNNIEFDDLFDAKSLVLQEDYLYQLNKDRLESLRRNIESEIKEEGIDGVEVIISANIFKPQLTIDAVFVDISEMVIIGNGKNINTNDIITDIVQSKINIKKEQIVFNE